nr:cytochrome c oxydase subunit 2 [Physella acuta]
MMDPANPMMEEMVLFHDHAMAILLGIFVFVVFMSAKIIMSKFSSNLIIENHILESIWTIVPGVILIFLAWPSIVLLYLMDETPTSGVMMKVIGHQWYWTFEGGDTEFDMYMVEAGSSTIRNLDVDVPAQLTCAYHYQTLITSSDVIHSFAVPSMAVKVDAVPGRLNMCNLFTETPGVYYGQCSEICGANHSFMPVQLNFSYLKVSMDAYIDL